MVARLTVRSPSLHLLFPLTDNAEVELVRRALEEVDLLGGERDLRRPHRIRNVALLRHADDGERPLADRPRNGNLSDADTVFVREEFQRQVERLDP